jgi:hypothetical protein
MECSLDASEKIPAGDYRFVGQINITLPPFLGDDAQVGYDPYQPWGKVGVGLGLNLEGVTY